MKRPSRDLIQEHESILIAILQTVVRQESDYKEHHEPFSNKKIIFLQMLLLIAEKN